MLVKTTIERHKLLIVFSIIYLMFSALTYKDYGITSDEQLEYRAGTYYFRFVISSYGTKEELLRKISLKDDPTRFPYYGVYPAVVSLLNFKGYYEWSHLVNLIFGLLSFISAYLITYAITKSRLSILSPIMLFLNPYYFGHIPANPKDIPFSWLYLACVYFIAFYKNKKTIHYALLGVLIALVSATRLIGVILFMLTALKVFFDTDKNFKHAFVIIFITCASALSFLYLTWPYLWSDPVSKIGTLFATYSDFSYWDRLILYKGVLISKAQRPWDYLFHYILIKTPIIVLFGFLISTILTARKLFILHSTIWLNLGLYLLIQPVIYNEMRHFLYLIPLITVCSGVTFIWLLKSARPFISKSLKVLIILSFVKLGTDHIQLHPYQYVYFNELAGTMEQVARNYELDYWSASYKESAEYLRNIAKDSEYPITVYPCNLAFGVDYYSHKTFSLVNKSEEADYYICDYMNALTKNFSLKAEVVYEVKRKGAVLSYVAKTLK